MPKFFVFLGNERPALATTRHNAGFIIADEMAKKKQISPFAKSSTIKPTGSPSTKDYEVSYSPSGNIFIKPLALNPRKTATDPGFGFGDINSAGFAVKEWLTKKTTDDGDRGESFPTDFDHEISPSDVVVFCDSLSNEEFPKARYVSKSTCLDETHNGVKSIANEIGGGFVVVDLPIGKQAKDQKVTDYVIGNFSPDELKKQKLYAEAIEKNMKHLAQGHFGKFNLEVANYIKNAHGKASPTNASDTIDKAIKLSDEVALAEHIKHDLEEKDDVEQAAILTKILTKTFDQHTSFSLTKSVLDEIKKRGLFEIVIARQKEAILPLKELILHSAVKNRAGAEKMEILMEYGFGGLVDVAKDGITALEEVLQNPTLPKKEALQMFWQMYHYASDPGNIDRCIALAKVQEKHFTLNKEIDMASDMEIARMLPHRLLKEYRNYLDSDFPKPNIFVPYYDYKWGRAPAQVLQDFCCDLVKPDYDIADDKWFASDEALTELRTKIEAQVASCNGFVALGNDANIDPRFFTEGGDKINLTNFDNRRTYVEMIGLQAAIKMNKPIWTICGGTQMAVTALGGKVGPIDPPQDLRGKADLMRVERGSDLHLATHSKKSDRGDDLLDTTKTWSAHYQGAAVEKTPVDDFSFAKLPEELTVVAVSATSPHIPKAYQMGDDLFMQSHLEADPSTNPVSRNAIGGFVKRCRENLAATYGSTTTDPAPNPTSNKILKLLEERINLRAAAGGAGI